MFTRVMLIGLLVIGAVAMLETDANAQRSCGAWGCSWGSTIMCAELTNAPSGSRLRVTFTNITVEAICIGPQDQVVRGRSSNPDIIAQEIVAPVEPGTGHSTACVEVETDVPEDEICNNAWTKAPGSDAIISYNWIGEWLSKQGRLLDTDTGVCSGEPDRDENHVPQSGLGSCDCTEINPD
jgi:hypothetical protein